MTQGYLGQSRVVSAEDEVGMTRKFLGVEPATESHPGHDPPDKKFWSGPFRANATHDFAPLGGRKNVHCARFPQLPNMLAVQILSATVPDPQHPKAILSRIRENLYHLG